MTAMGTPGGRGLVVLGEPFVGGLKHRVIDVADERALKTRVVVLEEGHEIVPPLPARADDGEADAFVGAEDAAARCR